MLSDNEKSIRIVGVKALSYLSENIETHEKIINAKLKFITSFFLYLLE